MWFSRITLFILLSSAAIGCGSTPAPVVAETDASNADLPPKAGFGQACQLATGCGPGLQCMQSEFAPFGWCTRDCNNPKDYCVGPELGGKKAFCVLMPDGWQGQKAAFCAPICDNLGDCHALAPAWEKCEKPTYKQAVLAGYNALPTKVCDAPSSFGQIIVDPITCAAPKGVPWKDAITDPDPGIQEAKQVCDAFCGFLTSCQLFDAKLLNPNCCTWHCFQSLTPSGNIDNAKKSKIKCYNNAFYTAFANTSEVCTGYNAQCGPLCKSDKECDDQDACTADVCLNFRCTNNAIPGCK